MSATSTRSPRLRASSDPPLTTTADSIDMRARYMYVITECLGCCVEVTVKDGSIFQGVLHTVTPDKDSGVVLKMARKMTASEISRSRSDSTMSEIDLQKIVEQTTPIDQLLIRGNDFIQLICTDVERGIVRGGKGGSFLTDVEVSAGRGGQERELQVWNASDSGELLEDLELSRGRSNNSSKMKQWDQFAINEQLFNVTTTFDENLYTTKLDKNSDAYKAKEARAAKLAAEIERSTTSNIHIQEERGQTIGVDYDEEERYGSVVRDTASSGLIRPPSAQSLDYDAHPGVASAGILSTSSSGTSVISSQSFSGGVISHSPETEAEKRRIKSDINAVRQTRRSPLRAATEASVADVPAISYDKIDNSSTDLSGTAEKENKNGVDPKIVYNENKSNDKIEVISLNKSTGEETPVDDTPTKKKLNPFAKEFKLNINASSFVPVVSPGQSPNPQVGGGKQGSFIGGAAGMGMGMGMHMSVGVPMGNMGMGMPMGMGPGGYPSRGRYDGTDSMMMMGSMGPGMMMIQPPLPMGVPPMDHHAISAETYIRDIYAEQTAIRIRNSIPSRVPSFWEPLMNHPPHHILAADNDPSYLNPSVDMVGNPSSYMPGMSNVPYVKMGHNNSAPMMYPGPPQPHPHRMGPVPSVSSSPTGSYGQPLGPSHYNHPASMMGGGAYQGVPLSNPVVPPNVAQQPPYKKPVGVSGVAITSPTVKVVPAATFNRNSSASSPLRPGVDEVPGRGTAVHKVLM